MKHLLLIAILSISLTECSDVNNLHRTYCPQEIELLGRGSAIKAVFDFSLGTEEQFQSLQQQTEVNLCNGRYVLDTRFELLDTIIETALIVDVYCDPSELTEIYPLTHPIYAIDLYLDSVGQITVEDSLVQQKDLVERLSKGEWYGGKHVAFRIDWHSNSSIEERQNLFQWAVDGYLLRISNLANERFGKPICELETDEIDTIRRNFKFAYVLGNRLRSMPPHRLVLPGLKKHLEGEIE